MAICEIGVSFPDDTFGEESRYGVPFTVSNHSYNVTYTLPCNAVTYIYVLLCNPVMYILPCVCDIYSIF